MASDRLLKVNVPFDPTGSPPVTATTSYTYDKAGRKTSETDPNLIPTLFSYDVRGRLYDITYTDGLTMGYRYDGASNLKQKIDRAGRATNYSYDQASRLTEVKNPLLESTDYTYDEMGRLGSILDANSIQGANPNLHKTTFKYDELGRQTRKTWANGATYEAWGYDRVGNQTSHRLGDGQTNLYEYDTLNRLTKIQYAGEAVATSFAYTPAGLRQTAQDGRGLTTYTYDARDRLKTIKQPGSSTPDISYAYDPAGNRKSLTTPSGTVNYTYDPANRLKTVQEPNVAIAANYFYDLGGRREKLNLANGAVVTYTYDTLNRLTNLNHYPSSTNSTPLSAYVYAYDGSVAAGKVGLKTGVTEYQGSSTPARTLAWVYDEADRLKSEAWTEGALPAVTTSFTYDKTGNRQSQTIGSATTSYGYNSLDQLKTVTDTSGVKNYTYDGRGNLARIGQGNNTQTFTFNGADRLVAFVSTSTPSLNSTYTYDADGRRVKAVVGGGSSQTTNFLWDEASQYGDVVRETDGNGSLKTSYTLSGVSGELLSQKRAGATGPEYYLLDGRGSVRGLATNSGANVVVNDRYAYDAFGTAHTGSTANFGTTPNVYRYTSQQLDTATGLYDLRARYYNPGEGRFLSQDTWPIDYSNPVELNRYVYTANNPINYTDPSGNYIFVGIGLFTQLTTKQAVIGGLFLGAITGLLLMVLIFSAILAGAKKQCDNFSDGRTYECIYTLANEQTVDLATNLQVFGGILALIGAVGSIIGGLPSVVVSPLITAILLILTLSGGMLAITGLIIAGHASKAGGYAQVTIKEYRNFVSFPTSIRIDLCRPDKIPRCETNPVLVLPSYER